MGSPDMARRRAELVALAATALLATSLSLSTTGASGASADGGERPVAPHPAEKATVPTGFRDTTAIGGVSQAVAGAFVPDGTAFVALQTGVIKSFDYSAATGQFEPAATSTD